MTTSNPKSFWNAAMAAIALAAGGISVAAQPAPLVQQLQLQPHHVTARVMDLDRAVAWYQSKLGLTLVERGERAAAHMRFAELSMPGYGIALVQFTAPAAASAAAPAATASAAQSGAAWLHIVFSTPDLEQALKSLEAQGLTVEARRNGGKLGALEIHDPDGNEIELVAR